MKPINIMNKLNESNLETNIEKAWNYFIDRGADESDLKAAIHWVNSANVPCGSTHHSLKDTKLFANIYQKEAKGGKVKVTVYDGETSIDVNDDANFIPEVPSGEYEQDGFTIIKSGKKSYRHMMTGEMIKYLVKNSNGGTLGGSPTLDGAINIAKHSDYDVDYIEELRD